MKPPDSPAVVIAWIFLPDKGPPAHSYSNDLSGSSEGYFVIAGFLDVS